ncbi:hypothetical protein HDU89_008674 [Geranomyces variabilis]|nr:hypothetical protein HDU89_008674 [Geranomyces variabilis]
MRTAQYTLRCMVDVPLDDGRTLRLACAGTLDTSASLAVSEDDSEYAEIERSSYYAYIVGGEVVLDDFRDSPGTIYNANYEGPHGEENRENLFRMHSKLKLASVRLGIPESQLAEYLHCVFPSWARDVRFKDANGNWTALAAHPGPYMDQLMTEWPYIYTEGTCRRPYCPYFLSLFTEAPELDHAVDALMACTKVDKQTWAKLLGVVPKLATKESWIDFPLNLGLCLYWAQNPSRQNSTGSPKQPSPVFLRDNATLELVRWASRHIECHEYKFTQVDGHGHHDGGPCLLRLSYSQSLVTKFTLRQQSLGDYEDCDVEFLGESLGWDDISDTNETGQLKFGLFVNGTAIIESGQASRKDGERRMPVRFDIPSLSELYSGGGFDLDFSDVETFGLVLLAACLSLWQGGPYDPIDAIADDLNPNSKETHALVAEVYPWAKGRYGQDHIKLLDFEFVHHSASTLACDNGFSRAELFLTEQESLVTR